MRGLGLIAYGVEGIGKTGFAAQFPKPLRFISVRESGFEDLQDIDEIPEGCTNINVDSWGELLEEMEYPGDNKTIVIDSLSGVSQICKDEILRTVYSNHEAPLDSFGSFSEGWRIHAPMQMEELENRATRLRSKGTNIIFIGHTKIEKSKNVVSTDYQSAMLDMESWPRAVLTKWAQAVLFMAMDFKVTNTKMWRKKATEAKVETDFGEEVARIMYTTKHPSHSAKNRLKLPPFIMMGESAEEAYENFVKKLPTNFQEALRN